ncbi:MAG: tRNA threonylcarbamoyladenosine dehydratase, partial [Lachnospiraceae bacterium]|nr:tRNA threonylcarbamoyladenosine dehydratase [Lachnospiraceae bacterium]
FYLPETADLFDFTQYDYVVDAIDTVTGKIQIIMEANKAGVPVISSMGAGNKLDPTAFEVADIYETSVCPLAKVMRKELKKRGIEKLKVVYSKEKALKPISGENVIDTSYKETKAEIKQEAKPEIKQEAKADTKPEIKQETKQPEIGENVTITKRQTPGSVSFVPSVVGLIIGGEVIKDLIKIKDII